MKKVLIEFFDGENLNNCISQLHESFDKVVYLYFEDRRNARSEILFDALTDFNRTRAGTIPEYHPIKSRDIGLIINKLGELTDKENHFRFDITGGPELFIAAAGLFYGLNPDVSISIRQYDIITGKVTVSYPDAGPANEKNYTLSVREIVKLHGSAIENGTFRHNLNEDNLEKNIIRLWEAVKEQRSSWNKFCCLQNISRSSGGKTVFLKGTDSPADGALFDKVVAALEKKGLVRTLHPEYIEGKKYSSFVSEMPGNTDFLYKKGGNILEMLTFAAVTKSGKAVDALVGVPVDWDGEITGERGETKNEIDLILSDGRAPIFISCKNTEVSNDFLYELQSVAMHYGGRYAKCVLVSTASNSIAIRKRAADMRITLIDNICTMKTEEYFKIISEVCFPG